jgi:hypothetical protein
MKACNHTFWIGGETQNNQRFILHTNKLIELLEESQTLNQQRPSLFVLIGNTRKSQALKEIISNPNPNQRKWRRACGEIHLQLTQSAADSRPILISDGDLTARSFSSKSVSQNCHAINREAIVDSALDILPSSHHLSAQIYANLLLPFTDVFCFFSADLGGLRSIARHISLWLDSTPTPNIPKDTFPQILIVVDRTSTTKEKELKLWFLQLVSSYTTNNFQDLFSGLQMYSLPTQTMPENKRYRQLKSRLLSLSNGVRKSRAENHLSFKAEHFNAFFRLACKHFIKKIPEPFDFVRASRQRGHIREDLGQHLFNVVKKLTATQDVLKVAVPIIASTFFLNNYPPNSPGRVH